MRVSRKLPTALLAAGLAAAAPCAARSGASAVPASAVPRGVYAGTLERIASLRNLRASRRTTLEIAASSSRPARSLQVYFYRAYGVGIEVAGRRSNDGSLSVSELRFDENAYYGASTPGQIDDAYVRAWKNLGGVWRVRVRGDRIEGTWRTAESRPLFIRLTRVGDLTRKTGLREHDDADAYDRELVREKPLRSEPISRSGGAYVILHDPRFGVTSFEIVRFQSEGVRSAVNTQLSASFDDRRIDAAECFSYTSRPLYEQRAAVSLFSRNVFAIERTRVYCGGAHPTVEDEPGAFDLRTGRLVDWAAAIAQPAMVESAYIRKAKAIVRERNDNISSACIAELTRYGHFGPSPREIDAYILSLEAAGLVIRADFSHAVQSCAVPVTLRYADVKSSFAPAYRALLP